MEPHIRSHRAPCPCFLKKVSLQLSSEQSLDDVGITQLDWKRVAQARSRGCKSSLPKMMINDTISLLFKSAISIFVISNRNRFRVLFDKIASVYFYLKNIYLHFSNGFNFYFQQHDKYSPFNSTRYVMLYPQNGDHRLRDVTSSYELFFCKTSCF